MKTQQTKDEWCELVKDAPKDEYPWPSKPETARKHFDAVVAQRDELLAACINLVRVVAWIGNPSSDELAALNDGRSAIMNAEAEGKTNAPNKAQHSPLQVLESIKDLLTGDQLAKIGFYQVEPIIVASVNHAYKLAEALAPFAYSVKGEPHDDAEIYRIGNWNVYGRDINKAHEALAAWEKANG